MPSHPVSFLQVGIMCACLSYMQHVRKLLVILYTVLSGCHSFSLCLHLMYLPCFLCLSCLFSGHSCPAWAIDTVYSWSPSCPALTRLLWRGEKTPELLIVVFNSKNTTCIAFNATTMQESGVLHEWNRQNFTYESRVWSDTTPWILLARGRWLTVICGCHILPIM